MMNTKCKIIFIPGILKSYNLSVYYSKLYSKLDFELLEGPDYMDSSSSGYYLDDFVQHAMSKILKFQKQTIILVGYSLGGAIATRIAEEMKDKIHHLVLMSSPGIPHRNVKILNGGIMMSPTRKGISRLVDSMFIQKKDIQKVDIEKEYTYYMEKNRKRFKSLLKTARNTNKIDLRDSYKKIEIPTTIIWGENDHILPIKIAFQTQKLIKKSQLYVLDNCGHAPIIEKEDEVVQIIKKLVIKH